MQQQIVLILDASFVIAICEKMDYPEFIDELLKLNYKLVIPSLVWERELKCNPAHDIIDKYCKEGKIEIISLNTAKEVDGFLDTYRKIHFGEKDVFLSYIKLKKIGIKACCIFDDKRARIVAEKPKIEIKGTVGLLKLLKENKIISPQKIKEISKMLDKRGFRLSRNLIESD